MEVYTHRHISCISSAYVRENPTPQNSLTPWKINMEPENDGLEDDVPFQLGDFSGSMLVFGGV